MSDKGRIPRNNGDVVTHIYPRSFTRHLGSLEEDSKGYLTTQLCDSSRTRAPIAFSPDLSAAFHGICEPCGTNKLSVDLKSGG